MKLVLSGMIIINLDQLSHFSSLQFDLYFIGLIRRFIAKFVLKYLNVIENY